MNVKFACTRLLVNDWKACFNFYKNVMEFEVSVEDEQSGYAEFKVADMKFELFHRQEMAQMISNSQKPTHAECQDPVVLIFTVQDLDEECQQLKHKGVQMITTPTSNPYYGIKTVYFRDPDENLIGLFQPLA
ncbi:MAG: VOC family protein [Hydrococcus sp. Prado102]|jgi:predicted enzyme related to lactoylglutathione lyase|nr:VOC family protein [Hydrococcus sp. Prado102]